MLEKGSDLLWDAVVKDLALQVECIVLCIERSFWKVLGENKVAAFIGQTNQVSTGILKFLLLICLYISLQILIQKKQNGNIPLKFPNLRLVFTGALPWFGPATTKNRTEAL